MSRLYEVNEEFSRIAECCEWDDERKAWIDYDTGEIMTDEEYRSRIFALNEEHDRIMEWCVKTYLDDNAKVEMLSSEINRLTALKKFHERRAERMKFVVDREQNGVSKDYGFAKVSYRTSKPVTWSPDDEQKIIAWLMSNDHEECIKKSFEIRKKELGKLIDSGSEVATWAKKEEKKNISIK